MFDFKKFFAEIMQQDDGAYSSKRTIAFIGVALMVIAFFANLFWGFNIAEQIWDAIKTITMTALGLTGVEKFVPKPGGSSKPVSDSDA